MTDLRKAAENILKVLDGKPELLVSWLERLKEAREALRQALAQPEREWVGLTDREIHEIVYEQMEGQHPAAGFRTANCIEAKLKEKNHAD
jgi:hypothetical protein